MSEPAVWKKKCANCEAGYHWPACVALIVNTADAYKGAVTVGIVGKLMRRKKVDLETEMWCECSCGVELLAR